MKPPTYSPVYAAALYPALATLFRSHGYALAVHGSLQRDLDLIAVPWIESPSPPDVVMAEVADRMAVRIIGEPTWKVHGRMAWTVSVGFGQCAIDLSFIPVKERTSKQMNNYGYGYKALTGIPKTMAPWGMRLDLPSSSEYGEYVLVDVGQADIEQHHQVEVIDENGDPLRKVWVIFGYPGAGPDIDLAPTENYWRGAPSVLKGNARQTNVTGYAQHTFQSGGEDIWIWDIDDGVLKLPSPIVKGCHWVSTPTGKFEHTGVKLLFQRRSAEIKPRGQLQFEHETRIATVEAQIKELQAAIHNANDRLDVFGRGLG